MEVKVVEKCSDTELKVQVATSAAKTIQRACVFGMVGRCTRYPLQGIFYQRFMIVNVIFRHLKFKCSDAETGNCLSAQRQNSLLSQVRGGKLKARKGVNVPEVQIDCAALTEKDIEDPNVGIRNHSVNDSLRGSNS